MAVTSPAQKAAAQALLAKAAAANAGNVAFNGVPNPGVPGLVAQVQALTRQVNALTRLVAGMYGAHGQLDDGPDT